MKVIALLSLCFASCGTASYVEVLTEPAGARIYVEGVDTGRTAPAKIDLERYAPNPDRPMRIEVRRAGAVPTVSAPYRARHECWIFPCEHKVRHYPPCRLVLLESGGGVRIDVSDRRRFEVSFDGGEWLPVVGPARWSDAHAGRTFPLPPGEYEMRFRTLGEQSDWNGKRMVTVPKAGYVAIGW